MPLLPCRLVALLVVGVGGLGPAVVAHAGTGAADDPVFTQGLQWSLDEIDAPEAWRMGTGEGIRIAVVDSGVDLDHEDLRDKVVAQVSCVGADGDPSRCRGSAQDDNGHGTHVAGIALASTGNGRGLAGVAPDADLLAVRVLTNTCDAAGDRCEAVGTSADVAAGIRWAADHGADVINLSLGGGALQSILGCAVCDAIDEAWSKGAIPVLAAGTDAALPAGFADAPAVVVSATTRDDAPASYSRISADFLRSARWPVAAPGGEGETDPSDCATGGTPNGVLSTYWVAGRTDQYACMAGTSMAAPHVSGALAILRGLGLTPQQAVARLLVTADDLGVPGPDDAYGRGRIDLAAATRRDAPDRGPAISPTSPTRGTAPSPPAATTPSPARSVPVGLPPGLTQAAPFRPAADASDDGPSTGSGPLAVLALAGATGLLARHRATRSGP